MSHGQAKNSDKRKIIFRLDRVKQLRREAMIPPENKQGRISEILDPLQPPEWPENIFPSPLKEFVSELAHSTETPIELAALVVIAVLGTASQGKYVVQVKENYFEPLNIWTCVALPSGQRKSAIYTSATKPLAEWEKLQANDLKLPIQEAKSKNEFLKKKIEFLRNKGAKENQSQFDKNFREIQLLESQLVEVPKVPQLWSADITPENLGIVMAENGGRMAILSDEGGIFDNIAGRYSGGIPNMDVFLQGHAGTHLRVDRATRPPIFVQNPALTLGLTIQGELLQGLTKCPSFRGRGLLARFLFCIPRSNIGYRTFETMPMKEFLFNEYSNCITGILQHAWKSKVANEPHILKMSASAFQMWKIFATCNESHLADEQKLGHLQDWGSKLTGAVARLAALFHIARYAQEEPWKYEIGGQDMQAAMRLADALTAHALIAFDLMGSDKAMDGARLILKWIKRMRIEHFTFRSCHYAHKSRFKKAADLRPAIEILIETGIITLVNVDKARGRPSEVYVVSDEIAKEG